MKVLEGLVNYPEDVLLLLPSTIYGLKHAPGSFCMEQWWLLQAGGIVDCFLSYFGSIITGLIIGVIWFRNCLILGNKNGEKRRRIRSCRGFTTTMMVG